MKHKKHLSKVAFKISSVALFLCSPYLLATTCFADEPVTEINNWSDLLAAAKDPTIKTMRLNYDVSSSNTCAISWKVTSDNRILDLNGHSITSKGGSSGDCVMNILYDTGWNNYSFTIENGELAQDFTETSTSSLLYARTLASTTTTNFNLVLRNVDMKMSPSVTTGSAIRFEQATNKNHPRRLEIDGGKYTVARNGAISFQTYLSRNGNTEYSTQDKIVLKRMQIGSAAPATTSAKIFYNHINKPLSSIIHADSELYDGESLVTDLSPVNYSASNNIIIRLKRTELPNLAVSLDNWTYGETPKTPEVTGNLESGMETFSYRIKGTEGWNSETPTAVGNYELKVNVAQTENYLEGEATTEFSIFEHTESDSTRNEELSNELSSSEPTEDKDKNMGPPNTGSFTDKDSLNTSIPIICFCFTLGIIITLILIRKRNQ